MQKGKRQIDRNGRLRVETIKYYRSQANNGKIASEIRRKQKVTQQPQLGPRKTAYEAFKKCGKIDEVCKEVDEKFGEGAFSKEQICQWIKEELERDENKIKDLGEER